MALKWTQGALRDLSSIAAYIAQDNPSRAETFVKELRQKIDKLSHFQIGQVGRILGTREYVVHKNYLAIYRVRNEQVQTLRVQHAARNR